MRGGALVIAKGYIFGILYVLSVVLFAEILYKIGMPKKYTRKVVHVLVGFEWIILYHFFGAGIHSFLLCLVFLILLIIEYKIKLLPMMSSDGENSPGTVYYAAAMTAVSFVCIFCKDLIIPFGIAVMATSLGDGLAGIVGQALKRNNPTVWRNKTLFGSIAGLLATLCVTLLFSHIFELRLHWLLCLSIALFATELEVLTPRGLDNISVTLGSFLYSAFLIYHSAPTEYILPILFTPIILAFVIRRRALTPSGILAALLLDALASIAFGNLGFLILVLYFVGSILSDKYKNSRKCKEKITNNDKTRTVLQVLANGAVPLVFSIVYLFKPDTVYFLAFAASLSEALSDTVASGVGSSAKRVFDPIRLKEVTPGESGGVSHVGTLSAIISAFALSSLTLLFDRVTPFDMVLVSFSAIFGVFLDTFLGSLLQARYKCSVCRDTVEQRSHCNARTTHVRGFKYLDNSAVNFISSAASAILIFILK